MQPCVGAEGDDGGERVEGRKVTRGGIGAVARIVDWTSGGRTVGGANKHAIVARPTQRSGF